MFLSSCLWIFVFYYFCQKPFRAYLSRQILSSELQNTVSGYLAKMMFTLNTWKWCLLVPHSSLFFFHEFHSIFLMIQCSHRIEKSVLLAAVLYNLFDRLQDSLQHKEVNKFNRCLLNVVYWKYFEWQLISLIRIITEKSYVFRCF